MTDAQMNIMLDRLIAREEGGETLDSRWSNVESYLRTKLNRPEEGGEGGGGR